MTAMLVAAGGALGAVLRFLADRGVRRRYDSDFPLGTLVVNVTGSLLLGFLTGASLFGLPAPALRALLGVGFCGALTTFSTFGYETVRLFLDGARLRSAVNVAVTVFAGLGAGVTGLLCAAALWG